MSDDIRAALRVYREPQPSYTSLMDACRTLADAYHAQHPADDAEPVTAEWLISQGGTKVEDTRKPFDETGSQGTWPKVRYGEIVWYTNLWSTDEHGACVATYFLKYQGACLGSSPELTRGQFRTLRTALGVGPEATRGQ